MVGAGFTGRRAIVDNDKCENCHAALGASPTFHAGNRNDGPTCSVCPSQNGNNNGWSYNSMPAASTTLVTSPIMAACVACHDNPADCAHMVGNGGSFYVARGAVTEVEQCLICHGPDSLAPIARMHQ